MDSGRGNMGLEWSGAAQLKFKGSTLYLKIDFTPHNSKVKGHLKFSELDINASQACFHISH